MAFLNKNELSEIPFLKLGKNVKISKDARLYNPELMEIGDNSRIDDFCVLSGKIIIGKNVHIAANCLLSGGSEGIYLYDFSGLAYCSCVFSRSDDYSGKTLTNPTIPKKYQENIDKKVTLEKHVIIGARSVVFPGVTIKEGSALGANSMLTRSTEPWKIYFGSPAKAIKNRSQKLLELEKKFLEEKL